MFKAVRAIRKMLLKQEGQGMVEYGLIIGLVSVLLIGALTALSGDDGIGGSFQQVTDTLTWVLTQ